MSRRSVIRLDDSLAITETEARHAQSKVLHQLSRPSRSPTPSSCNHSFLPFHENSTWECCICLLVGRVRPRTFTTLSHLDPESCKGKPKKGRIRKRSAMSYYGLTESMPLKSCWTSSRMLSRTHIHSLARRRPFSNRAISYLRPSPDKSTFSPSTNSAGTISSLLLTGNAVPSSPTARIGSWGSLKRTFQHKAPKPEDSAAKLPLPSTQPPPAKSPLHVAGIPTQAEQRRVDWNIVKKLMGNVWPKNDWKTRLTVLGGFGLLVSAKVRTSCTPCIGF